MVNATYAVPAENTGLTSVRERLYRGPCLPEEITEKVSQLFLEKKDAFEKIIRDFSYLGERDKKDMLHYLGKFFDILEDKTAAAMRSSAIVSDHRLKMTLFACL